jgi:hypothetical protein
VFAIDNGGVLKEVYVDGPGAWTTNPSVVDQANQYGKEASAAAVLTNNNELDVFAIGILSGTAGAPGGGSGSIGVLHGSWKVSGVDGWNGTAILTG